MDTPEENMQPSHLSKAVFESRICETQRAFSRAGACLMAERSKATPLTAGCLSSLPGFESRPGHLRTLPVTCSKAVVFRLVLRFPPLHTSG